MLICLGSRRQTIDHQQFVNEVDAILEIIENFVEDPTSPGVIAPEVIDELEAEVEDLFISQAQGKRELEAIREEK